RLPVDRERVSGSTVDPAVDGCVPDLLAHHLDPDQPGQPPPPTGGSLMTTIDLSRPPIDTRSPIHWARRNLFSTWYNTLLTLIFGVLGVWLIVGVLVRIFSSDLTILRVNLTNLMVGRYPRDELWRVAVSLVGFAFVVGIAVGYNG